MKRRPSGFTATCQCGVMVGALDAERTERKEMGRILGEWLYSGCTVSPYFEGTHCFSIGSCQCGKEPTHDN